MNNTWIETLENLGATISANNQLTAKPSKIETLVTPLIHQQLISVIGEQATSFLQGQLSCDMTSIQEHGSGLGAHCNIKGSMIALYRLFTVDGGYCLRVNSDLACKAQESLNKYIIFSKAETHSLADEKVGLGLSGPGAAALVERLFDRAPSEVNSSIFSAGMLVSRLPNNCFELWLPVETAVAQLPSLLEKTALGSTNDWLLTEITAGIPSINATTSELFIPQMTNLQAHDGVSFTKGCYTGQEIITRLQHRGKLNKSMYRAQLKSERLPLIGEFIDSPDRAKVGQVIASAHNQTHIEVLAVINKAAADQGDLHLEGSPADSLSLLNLPYMLDPQLFERKS